MAAGLLNFITCHSAIIFKGHVQHPKYCFAFGQLRWQYREGDPGTPQLEPRAGLDLVI
jgi:hypothetical protein